MKDKTKKALKSLLDHVKAEEAADPAWPQVDGVSKEDLKTLLRWAQNNAHVWFEGDRLEWTGATVHDYPWLEMGVHGTAYLDSQNGTVPVVWDNAPEGTGRVMMFHNEIKRVTQ